MAVRLAWRRRIAAALLAAVVGASAPPTQAEVTPSLDQGWSAADQRVWYEASQGSRLIPLEWLVALERPTGGAPFLDRAHVDSFRFLSREPGHAHGLPLGFAIDQRNDESLAKTKLRWRRDQSPSAPWVGLTCAACHTGELSYGGKTMRIDGGAPLADLQGFIEALNQSLVLTASEPPRFSRFAAKVLGRADDAANRALLSAALGRHNAWQAQIEGQNATALRYGHGRLDAVGRILNKVALLLDPANPPEPADAPVSYPFLWNTPQHDLVEYNGLARNHPEPLKLFGREADIGALGRNSGQAIGVFADLVPGKEGDSSVFVENIVRLDRHLATLRAPKWPTDIFPALDAAKVQRGAELFQQHCASCHSGRKADDKRNVDGKGRPLAHAREDLTSPVAARMVPLADVGTDVWMACNTYQFDALSGPYTGTRTRVFYGDRVEPLARGDQVLSAMVARVLHAKAEEIARSLTVDAFETGPYRPPARKDGPTIDRWTKWRSTGAAPAPSAIDKAKRKADCLAQSRKLDAEFRAGRLQKNLLAYKSRPLHGVWATAPFLHNGSVPTLYDLLL
ncbi:MAG: c-type cytochrome, partial [Alphaproteobacteria bacterium]|nr:c-type cytochrome [Alphaproteobacteria bacterium]